MSPTSIGRIVSELINIGVGIGIPGIIDYKNGKIILSAQPGWKNVNVTNKIRECTN